jgi:hypothetical protein
VGGVGILVHYGHGVEHHCTREKRAPKVFFLPSIHCSLLLLFNILFTLKIKVLNANGRNEDVGVLACDVRNQYYYLLGLPVILLWL